MSPDDVMAAVDAVMSRPFEWGVCDCVLSATRVFEQLHGCAPLVGVAPWHCRREAVLVLRAGGGLRRLVTEQASRIGLQDGHAIGGLALSENRRTLLICVQPGWWAGKTNTGFAILRQVAQGWHV